MSTPQDNSRLDYMAQELESLKLEVSEMKIMVKDIHALLAGNPIDKTSEGLLGDIKSIKAEMNDIKDQLKKYKAYFYALATLIGLGALKVIVGFIISK